MSSFRTSILALTLLLTACAKESSPAAAPPLEAEATQPAASAASESATGTKLGLAVPSSIATLGQAAPDFTLRDLDGKAVSLREYRGKTVVIEWFNPQCPYVKKAHLAGSLVDTAKRHIEAGVVWLAVNSGGEGRQGHGLEVNRQGKAQFSMTHPIMLDETGAVGKAYGATNTPQLFIIDGQGTLVYRGGIDNSPDAEQQSPQGGKLINYVDAALADLSSGRPVQHADTPPYGCSVKYASH